MLKSRKVIGISTGVIEAAHQLATVHGPSIAPRKEVKLAEVRVSSLVVLWAHECGGGIGALCPAAGCTAVLVFPESRTNV